MSSVVRFERRDDLVRSQPVDILPEIVESCRTASLQLGGPTLRGLGVTSTIRGEGRTSIATAMALIQNQDYGRNTLLIDFDFDNPSLDRRFRVAPWPGLAELVTGKASLDKAIQPVREGLSVITAGAPSGAAARLMIELARSTVLADIAGNVDVVIGDLPPLIASSFGRLAASSFPHLLLVVRAGITPLARIREATAGLPTEPVVILNGVQTSIPRWVRRLTGAQGAVLWIGGLLVAFVALGLRTKSSGSAHRAILVLTVLALGYAFFGLGR